MDGERTARRIQVMSVVAASAQEDVDMTSLVADQQASMDANSRAHGLIATAVGTGVSEPIRKEERETYPGAA